MSIAFRPAEERDRAFILSSWAAGFRDSHAAGVIPFPLYYAIYREQVLPWILARPGIQAWVAYNPSETDPRLDLYGHLVVERDVDVLERVRVPATPGRRRWETRSVTSDQPMVHWVFVKEAKRRLGIARCLFTAAGVDLGAPLLFSFKPAAWPELRHLAPFATWSPAIARREKEPPKEQR